MTRTFTNEPLTPERIAEINLEVRNIRTELWAENLPLMAEQYVALARNELDNACRYLTLAKYSVMQDK